MKVHESKAVRAYYESAALPAELRRPGMWLLLACGRFHFTLHFDCCGIAGGARFCTHERPWQTFVE